MVDVFTLVIKKLDEMGVFNFLLPFMLTTAIFYGLLRKSKIFQSTKKVHDAQGKEIEIEVSHGVNAVIALVAGFMVWAYPILSGVDVKTQLSAFFMQGTIVTLIFVVGLMMVSMFVPPNTPEQLKKLFENGRVGILLVIAIVIGVIIFVTSGLINLIVGPVFSGINFSNDTLLSIVVLGLLIVPLIFIFRGGTETVQPPASTENKKNEGEKKVENK